MTTFAQYRSPSLRMRHDSSSKRPFLAISSSRAGFPACAILGPEEARKMLAHDFVGTIARDLFGARIPADHQPVRIEHVERVVMDARDHQPQLLVALPERLLFLPLFADVAKDQDGPHRLSLRVEDRGAAVRDRALAPVAGDERRVVREPHHDSFRQHARDGIGGGGARLFVDDAEDLPDGTPDRFRFRPTGQPLRDRIDPRHARLFIRRQHTVADAVQRGLQALLASPQSVLGLFASGQITGDLDVSLQLSGGIQDRRDDDVGPESAAVLSNAPTFVFDAAVGEGGGQQRARLSTGHVFRACRRSRSPFRSPLRVDIP